MRLLLFITVFMSTIAISAQEQVFEYEHQNVTLHYREYGKGNTTLLMIHGLGSNSRAFDKLLASTSDHFRSVVVDLPGYGDSAKGEMQPGMKNYSEVLTAFIIQQGYTDVILVGHSMGGQIALTMAENTVEKPWLKGVFLLAPAGVETFTQADRDWFGQYVTPAAMSMLSAEQIKGNFDVNFASGKTPEDALFMYQDRIKLMENSDAYTDYLETVGANIQAMLTEPVIQGFPGIEHPVWVIYGEQDYLIPNRILHPSLTLEDLKKNCNFTHPKSRFLTIPNAGHFLVWDQPERIAELLEEFLNDV
ncbi:alpha/beta fold hydrolase [Robertkochia flava]|uniref:alpha/beta fold hydrolase n=1 Tax=Robertkochia flava TaxID=3447986 RepID=UPI001CC9D5E2|nr:alpha/beta hydrolase [Robertkochia marina]